MSFASAAARLASCGGGRCHRGALLLRVVSSSSVNGRGLSTEAEAADAVENRVKTAHEVQI